MGEWGIIFMVLFVWSLSFFILLSIFKLFEANKWIGIKLLLLFDKYNRILTYWITFMKITCYHTQLFYLLIFFFYVHQIPSQVKQKNIII